MITNTHWKQGWLLAVGGALALFGLAAEPSANALQVTTVPQVQIPLGGGGFATGDSNNRMIAVTGIDITGASILYLIDTVDPHIAVYQASGGASGTQGVKLVGARKIDLDLQLDGLNDKSEFTYKDLEKSFVDDGLLPAGTR